jgi:UDP-N-acetylglucosamine--N-acetylmuramyl-(pentapeptide) pyrophosphoryl-undecaprenol N-acetylglucosamine transferase
MSHSKTILIMAGGTGGHIMPGLAVAQALTDAGHTVAWLGGAGGVGNPSMESRLVSQHGYEFHAVVFGGVRGKGLQTKLLAPFRLLKAMAQTRKVYQRVRPDVVLGMGGYITVPGGLTAKLMGVPIVLHEQNSIAGMSNQLLAKIAKRVLMGFPNVFAKGVWVGNPVKQVIADITEPQARFAGRSGKLKLAVIGGSLGAQALNSVVPQALALIDEEVRPEVIHQSGEKQIEQLRANYAQAGVQGDCRAFIDDMAHLYSEVDLVICRAGAMTVAELASAGVASVLVPFPHAVDDHQTANAQLLVKAGAGVLMAQNELSAEKLADYLRGLTRADLLAQAVQARSVAKPNATADVAKICLAVAGVKNNEGA